MLTTIEVKMSIRIHLTSGTCIMMRRVLENVDKFIGFFLAAR